MLALWLPWFSRASELAQTVEICVAQEYAVPSFEDILNLQKKLRGYNEKLALIRLIAPKNSTGGVLTVEHIKTHKRHIVSLQKGTQIRLEQGSYRLLRDGYHVIVGEERNGIHMRSDQSLYVGKPNTSTQRLYLYCYPTNVLVTVRGRVLDYKTGKGVAGVAICGQPVPIGENAWYSLSETKTDSFGFFEFINVPPASFDVVVRFLLFGKIMHPAYNSENLFNYSVCVKPLSSDKAYSITRRDVPLISERNLNELSLFMRNLQMSEATIKKVGFKVGDESISLSQLPTSTNSVIYVPDIILPKALTPLD